MVVTFCGNRDASYSEEEKEMLCNAVEGLIIEGYNEFYLGGYGNFDIPVARTVRELAEKYTHIRSYLIIPYINMDHDKKLYDGSIYTPLETVPKRVAIPRRNKWMVEEAEVVVSGIKTTFGGAYTTLLTAKSTNKRIIDIIKD